MSKSAKSITMNTRIQYLVQSHVEVLAREIAEELARPLLSGFANEFSARLVDGRSSSGRGSAPWRSMPVEPIQANLNAEAAHYDPRTRKWRCPRCKKFSDFQRRAVTTHLRSCTAAGKPRCPKCQDTFETDAQLSGHLRWCGKDPKKAVIRTCIATGCKRPAKGPRNRFLCEKHLKASDKQVKHWREERAERNGA